VCDEDGDSHSQDRRVGERWVLRRTGRSPTTAPMDGTRGRWRGRSSTMMGRPRSRGKRSSLMMNGVPVAGDEGAVKVCAKFCGGVLGVGGESTMTMRSLRWVLVGRKVGKASLRRLE
jgi:hypothetical protein